MVTSLELTYVIGQAMRDIHHGVIDKNYNEVVPIIERIKNFYLGIVPESDKKVVGKLLYEDLGNLRNKLKMRKIKNLGLMAKLNCVLEDLEMEQK